MFTLSAFADEISPEPQEQLDVLNQCGVEHIELRSIHKTNVLDLTDLQVNEFKSLLDYHGLTLSAVGSPVGKFKVEDPFEPQLRRSPYEALVRAVVYQQLHGRAAAAILGRFIALFGGKAFPRPRAVLAMSTRNMRGAGKRLCLN